MQIVKLLRLSKYSSLELQSREGLMLEFAGVKSTLVTSIFTSNTELGSYARGVFALWFYEGTRHWFGKGVAGLPL